MAEQGYKAVQAVLAEGQTVRMPRVKESTALGAAMLAGIGAGLHPDIPTAARHVVSFEGHDPNRAPQRTIAI